MTAAAAMAEADAAECLHSTPVDVRGALRALRVSLRALPPTPGAAHVARVAALHASLELARAGDEDGGGGGPRRLPHFLSAGALRKFGPDERSEAERLEALPPDTQLSVRLLLRLLGGGGASGRRATLARVVARLPRVLLDFPPLAFADVPTFTCYHADAGGRLGGPPRAAFAPAGVVRSITAALQVRAR